MSFRIDPRLPLTAEVRRIAKDEIEAHAAPSGVGARQSRQGACMAAASASSGCARCCASCARATRTSSASENARYRDMAAQPRRTARGGRADRDHRPAGRSFPEHAAADAFETMRGDAEGAAQAPAARGQGARRAGRGRRCVVPGRARQDRRAGAAGRSGTGRRRAGGRRARRPAQGTQGAEARRRARRGRRFPRPAQGGEGACHAPVAAEAAVAGADHRRSARRSRRSASSWAICTTSSSCARCLPATAIRWPARPRRSSSTGC